MDIWMLFGYWLLTFLGLLWVKRVTGGRLRCNVFSAAIAAAIFLMLALGFMYLMVVIYYQGSAALKIAYFLFMALGLIPVASIITLFLGKQLIPGFKLDASDIVLCATYLTAWLFLALILVSILQILGFLFMGFLFGKGLPRAITRVSDDEYYHY